MQNPLSWSYLTAAVERTPVWGPFSIAFLVVFTVGLVVSVGLYYDVGNRLRGNRLLYDMVRRGAGIAMTVLGIGLFFFLFRLLHVSALGLHMRIWLYLTTLAAVAIGVYFWRYARNVYPEQVRKAEAERIKRRYLVPAVTGGSGGRSKKKKR